MPELVSYQLKEQVATITMDDGKANAISPAMVTALNSALDQAEKDRALVVLRGRKGMFSGGFDLAVMSQGMKVAASLIQSGSELARRLLVFPRPVIAVSEGHAVAMGCFLLTSCDYRIGVTGEFKYGLNEVAIGMTMHHAGIELARGRLTRRHFNRAVINAEMFSPQAAVEAGFLDAVVDSVQLDEALSHRLAVMAKLNADAFSNTKNKARLGLLEKIDWAIAQDEKDFKVLADQSD